MKLQLVGRFVKENYLPGRLGSGQIGIEPGLLRREDVAVSLLLCRLAVEHDEMHRAIVPGIYLVVTEVSVRHVMVMVVAGLPVQLKATWSGTAVAPVDAAWPAVKAG